MKENENLNLIEAIRKRPAMYIGSTSIRGFNNLLKYLIKDIFNSTKTDYFSFEIFGNVRGKFNFKNLQKNISDNMALDLWTKSDGSYQGFEFAALNALSKTFEIKVFSNNEELFHQV